MRSLAQRCRWGSTIRRWSQVYRRPIANLASEVLLLSSSIFVSGYIESFRSALTRKCSLTIQPSAWLWHFCISTCCFERHPTIQASSVNLNPESPIWLSDLAGPEKPAKPETAGHVVVGMSDKGSLISRTSPHPGIKPFGKKTKPS